MRPLTGLLWALGGALAGGLLGGALMLLVTKLANVTTREGFAGYTVGAAALLGALVGLVLGLVWYARSAPAGQAGAQLGSGVLGVGGLVALLAVGTWVLMQRREVPVTYDGAMATLELELRARTVDLPAGDDGDWLGVEVQTRSTRPEGTSRWDRRRIEGDHTIVPVFQQPLIRASERRIVVTLRGRHVETFTPSLARRPAPDTTWSAWEAPADVAPVRGADTSTPPSPVFTLRHRVRPYGT